MAINTSSLTQHDVKTIPLVAQPPVSENNNRGAMFVRMLPTLVINAVVPFAVNMVAQHYMPTIDALLLASAVPALYTLGTFAWKKHVDPIGLLVVAGLILTALFALIFKRPRMLLLQGSAVNGLFGVAMLASLLFPRPVVFYIIRAVVTQNNPQRVASFNADWEFPQVRAFYRVMSIVWGCVMLGQLLLASVLAYNLPISLMLVLGPIIGFALIMPAAHWSMATMRKNMRLFAQLRHERDAAQAM